MTRAIVVNKKIVGYEEIKKEFEKPTAEEYEKRQKGIIRKYNALKGAKKNEEI